MHHAHVFHHIPKCGGTSLVKAFSNWFTVIPDYRGAHGAEADSAYVARRVDLAGLTPHDMVVGHFEVEGAFLDQRYPEAFSDPRVRLLTFVRDPIELAQSLYWFERRNNLHPEGYTLQERVAGLTNVLAYMLRCDETNYRQVLDRYWFVGVCEHMQQSLDCLADALGRPRLMVPHINRSRRDYQLCEEAAREFRERNALDYAIYREAQTRFADFAARARIRPDHVAPTHRGERTADVLAAS